MQLSSAPNTFRSPSTPRTLAGFSIFSQQACPRSSSHLQSRRAMSGPRQKESPGSSQIEARLTRHSMLKRVERLRKGGWRAGSSWSISGRSVGR